MLEATIGRGVGQATRPARFHVREMLTGQIVEIVFRSAMTWIWRFLCPPDNSPLHLFGSLLWSQTLQFSLGHPSTFADSHLFWFAVDLYHYGCKMTAVGFEPTPLRTGALSQHLRPLGQTVLIVLGPVAASRCFNFDAEMGSIRRLPWRCKCEKSCPENSTLSPKPTTNQRCQAANVTA